MTVREAINLLAQEDPDMEVVIKSGRGYWDVKLSLVCLTRQTNELPTSDLGPNIELVVFERTELTYRE